MARGRVKLAFLINKAAKENHLKRIILKAQEDLKKLRHENRQKEMFLRVCYYVLTGMFPNDFNLVERKQLASMIDMKIMEIDELIEKTKKFEQGSEANKGIDGGDLGLETIEDVKKMET